MADPMDVRSRILELPPKRLALLALDLQAELERERQARSEPIAVVGMACRFPGGAESPEAYWHLLREGRDVVREVPADRWPLDELYDPDPDTPGRIATRWGGYLDDVQGFDAAFFSVSPREARAMDPQQRILLEVTWRAFEDAGIPPERFHGRQAGVFVGLCNNDYLTRLLKEGPEAIDAYLSSGNAYSVAAGRISFTFGFRGPAVTIDTACSSSLVALHDACTSLRGGESDLAVAAGVNVMSSPETAIALSRARMMAPDGRCKTFDDRADGFVRAEGCGVLVLKRLSDAVREGDRIHAVLRGSAIGQDGRSTGLTVPNGPAQEQVIRDALGRSGLAPKDIEYIEAHGTGTSLGDPIEMRSLGRVFGPGRDRPLIVGSVKTNMGHLESAAGIAGVIKTVLAVREGFIPQHLHFQTPSRLIEWDDFPLEVPARGRAWPGGAVRRAGVSSFGFSGTNAHVIVEEAPTTARPPEREVEGAEEFLDGGPSGTGRPLELLAISAATPEALEALSAAYRDALRELPDERFGDFCHTTRTGRTAFPWRRAVVAAEPAEVEAAFGLREGAPAVLEGRGKVTDPPEVAFVFTGQGAQHPGMGRGLYERDAAFREAIDRCAEILAPKLDVPLREVLFEGDGDAAPIYTTALAQPAIVAFEWALVRMWAARGVRPSAVMGHSLGEFAAACVAGVLSLEDMLHLVRERGRLLDTLPRGDRMAAIFAPAGVVRELLPADGSAVIGAFNAPGSTVVSGLAGPVSRVVKACAARGIDSRTLHLDRGFHSSRVDPILDELQRYADDIVHRAPSLPLAWNVTGRVETVARAGSYWRDHARQPVKFMQGVEALAARGIRHFLEIGPHPALSPLVAQTLERQEHVTVPTLRRGGDPVRDAAEAAGRLWVEGVRVDLGAFDAEGLCRMEIPGHPLTRVPYWVEPPAAPRPSAPAGSLPGARLSSPVPIFEARLMQDAPGFLGEHRFRGQVIVPGPIFVEAARSAVEAMGSSAGAVVDLRLLAPAVVGDGGLRLQTILEPDPAGFRFRVASLPADADDRSGWTEHARGAVRLASERGVPDREQGDVRTEPVESRAHLERLRALGFDLGPAAARWEDLEVGRGRARARLLPASAALPAVERALWLDAAAQVLGAALAGVGPVVPRMLAGIDEVVWVAGAGPPERCAAFVDESDERDGADASGDVVLFDDTGAPAAWLRGVLLRAIPTSGDARWHHRLEWRATELPAEEPARIDVRAVSEVEARVDEAWPSVAQEAGLERYLDELPALATRTAELVASALTSMGLTVEPGEALPADLAARLGVTASHGRLFRRLLAILAEEGFLVDAGKASYRFGDAAWPDPSPPEAPDGPVWALVERCGGALADVLTGTVDPLDLLFPDGDSDTTRAVYGDSPFGKAFNRAIGVALGAVVPATEAGRPLRILEAGAGSGATTRAALAALGAHAFTYTCTDVSPSLLAATEKDLGRTPGMRFQLLDLESDPAAQGVAPGSQDVIIAANVVHATSHVVRSLAHLRGMLAPGGVLILLEGIRAEPWVDVTFGLTAGWWRFQDRELRPDYPLLPLGTWHQALGAAGFEEPVALPAGGRTLEAGQVILVARNAGKPAVSAAVPTSSLGRALVRAGAERARGPGATVVVDGRGRTPMQFAETVRAMVDAAPEGRIRVVTEAAQSTSETDVPDPDQALLWGLARGFALEHPDRWGGIIDVAVGTSDDEVAARVLDELRAGGDEDQVAWRAARRLVPRLVPAPPSMPKPLEFRPGSYLVTGGLGGLGLHVADWLVSGGATRLVLIGRSADPEVWDDDDPRRAVLASLQSRADVLVRAVDVARRDQVDALLAELRDSGPALRGVVHAAAHFAEAPFLDLTSRHLATVLSAKVAGTKNLAAATEQDDLDFFAVFSSTTSILGVAGLSAYAAANQYLDAFAARARAEGRSVVSLGWGIWEEMRLASDEAQERYLRAGLRPMPTAGALEAMGSVLAAGVPHAVIADVDWGRLRALYEARRRRPILTCLGDALEDEVPGDAPTGSTGATPLAELGREERQAALVAIVEEEVRQVLRMPAGRPVDADEGFFAMGMDSLMSVELKGRLEKRLGTSLPATLTFNYPSAQAVTHYLVDRLGSPSGAAASASGTPDSALRMESDWDSDDLSEDELTALLEQRLAGLEGEVP